MGMFLGNTKEPIDLTKDFDLKLIRKRKGLTRKELSEKSGVSHETIKALENGINNPYDAKVSTLLKLATALNCRVRDFYPSEKVFWHIINCLIYYVYPTKPPVQWYEREWCMPLFFVA